MERHQPLTRRGVKNNGRINRRDFLVAGSAALIGLGMKSERRIEGGFVNDSFAMGHLLRDRAAFPAPRRQIRSSIVIVGGGMAGLSAAWRLQKRGFTDFVLLEMEQQAGGNSRWGENEITAYPWAAHYVPVPNKNAALVRELFQELGVLSADGQWEEKYLCFAPQERLYLHGRWQEGIEPAIGLTKDDREQFKRFEDEIQAKRSSGAFSVPMELGIAHSRGKFAELDKISFSGWLAQQKFTSKYLRWYCDYACRDDFGATAAETSAWTGIHYFAAREHEEKGPLTWPEGNGWIARRLIEKAGPHLRRGAMVHQIVPAKTKLKVHSGEIEYLADAVVFAAPSFLAPYLIAGQPPLSSFVYSPWLTANLTLDRRPRELGNAEPAWDNVSFHSPSLGYVIANHQSLRQHEDRSVWTFYWALAQQPPREARQLLLAKDWGYWKDLVLADLELLHPDIRECVVRIEVMRMGHAMVRPTPGFIFSDARRRMAAPGSGRIFFANSDLSGLSLFEEAQYRGVSAGDRALAAVTKR